MTMTDKEKAMLKAIVDSCYHAEDVFTPVWLWDVTDRFGPSAGGIMASLVVKGWAETTGVLPEDEGTCQITPAGVQALADVADLEQKGWIE